MSEENSMTERSQKRRTEQFRLIMEKEGVGRAVHKAVGYVYRNYIGAIYCQTIRRLMPTIGYSEYNGVRVPPDVAPQKKVGDGVFNFHCIPSKKTYKGYLSILRESVKKGDKVTIIGGGRGVSAVAAAWQVGETGQIYVYEGSPEMVTKIRKTTHINDVREQCDIVQKVVETGINVYGEKDRSMETISIDDVQMGDVLLMDCEGAEYAIMEQFNKQPRKIVIEIHPHKTKYEYDEIITYLSNMGYSLEETRDYHGNKIDRDRFDQLLKRLNTGRPDIDGTKIKNPIGVFSRDKEI